MRLKYTFSAEGNLLLLGLIQNKKYKIQNIIDADNPMEQLMNIWADVFFHRQPNKFIDLMVKNGIDGISKQKEDVDYYVIYNKNILN